jgi:hypothetical protein
MTSSQVREALEASPFTPFTLRLADGSAVRIGNPESALLPPKRRAIVILPDGGCPGKLRQLDVGLIVGLELDKPQVPTRRPHPRSVEARQAYGLDCIRLYRILLGEMRPPKWWRDELRGRDRLVGVCDKDTRRLRKLMGSPRIDLYHARLAALHHMGLAENLYKGWVWREDENGRSSQVVREAGEGIYVLRPDDRATGELRRYYHAPDEEIDAMVEEASRHPIVISSAPYVAPGRLRIWDPEEEG